MLVDMNNTENFGAKELDIYKQLLTIPKARSVTKYFLVGEIEFKYRLGKALTMLKQKMPMKYMPNSWFLDTTIIEHKSCLLLAKLRYQKKW